MTSATGVEAFLAAKWKTKKMEMEMGNNPPDNVSEYERKPIASPSKKQSPSKSPNQTDHKVFPTGKNEKKFQTDLKSEETAKNTGYYPVKNDGVLIPVIKSSNLSGQSLMKKPDEFVPVSPRREDDEFVQEDIVKPRANFGATKAQPGEGEIPDSQEITELRPVNSSKVGYYETTGDVWGLLEQQNDENEIDEGEELVQKPESKGNSENIDMVFGAISSEDIAKLSAKKGQESATEVPKMVIPFSNFGRLLGVSESEDRANRTLFSSNSLLKDLLSSQGQFVTTPNQNALVTVTNPFSQIQCEGTQGQLTSETEQHIDEAIRRVMYPITSKPKPAPRKNMAQNHPKTIETEADSTTFKRNLQNSDDLGQTNSEIIQTNLNQRLLPKPTKKRAVAGVKPSVYSYDPQNGNYDKITEHYGSWHNYDPELGPMESKNKNSYKPSQNDAIPISRFKVTIEPFAKTIVYNVLKYFENRKSQFNLQYNELKMTADATGMARIMVQKVMTEAQETQLENGKPAFIDARTRKMPKRKFSELNVKRDCIARMFIHNSYLIKKEVPTLKKIIQNCQENGFEKVLGTSAWFVKGHLKKLGFEYNARSGKKKFLIERPDFIAQRVRYLEEMQEHRAKKRNIVFVFVTDLLKKGAKNIEWEGWDGVFQEYEQGLNLPCVTIVHAASSNYVFHDCLQVMEHEVNSDAGLSPQPVIEWLTQKLLPKVPKGSVVVLGDQRFHQMADKDTRPHVGCTKEQIASWLRQYCIEPIDESRPKALLLEKAQKVVLDQKYVIDDELKAQLYIPVHIPVHHRDLNPMSFIWQDIKDQLDTSDAPSLRYLRQFVTEGFAKSAIKLGKAWTQVQKLEKSYYNIDMHTDAEKEALILHYGDGLVPIESSNETGHQSSSEDDDDPDNEEPPNKTQKLLNPREM